MCALVFLAALTSIGVLIRYLGGFKAAVMPLHPAGCLAFSLCVLASASCSNQDDPPGSMFMALGSEGPTQIYELGLDNESYDAVVEKLGFSPDGLGILGPREDGEAVVRFELSPDADSSFVSSFLAFQAKRGEAPTDVSILLGGGPVPIGLLLPAVQNLRSSGVHRDAEGFLQLYFELGGTNPAIDELSIELPEPEPKGDSFFDITYAIKSSASSSPDEKALIESARGPHRAIVANFGGPNPTGDVPIEDIAFYYDEPVVADLAESRLPSAGVLEVIGPNGDSVMRASAIDVLLVINAAEGSAELEGGKANLIGYSSLQSADTGTEAQVALFASDYAAYDSSAVDKVSRDLIALEDALDVSGKAALLAWHGGIDDNGQAVPETRTAITSNLVDAVLQAVISENLACTMATPDTIKAGRDPAINGGLNRDIIRRFRGDAAEAAFLAPPPGRLTIEMEKVLISSLGTMPEAEGGSTTAQCNAIATLAEVIAQGGVDFSSVAQTAQESLGQIGSALAVQRAAYLDRLVFEFVEHMNSRLPTDVDIEDEWATAAKTKACILIESLGNEATNGPLMHAAAKRLLGQ